jgi:hypothetical protein
MRAAKELLRLVVIMAPFLLVLPLGGAVLGGIRGFAVGNGVFYVIYLFVGWVTLARAAKRFEVDDAEGPEPLRDVLAREGLVEPISLADMLARQDGPEPVTLADMVARNGHPGWPAK